MVPIRAQIALLLICSSALMVRAQDAMHSSSERPFIDWARLNAVPLKTVEPGNGLADLEPLGSVVGDARIVSLGEATHGTREFFQLKHRIIEYLATRKGFTIFSIEANMPEAYRLNDFIQRGEGDPKELIKGMYFWTWDTQEVLDMVLWMREFNRSGGGHIEFTGFDMQTPNVAEQIVDKFVAQHEPGYSGEVAHTYEGVARLSKRPPNKFGVATASFPVELAAGRHIRFTGYIRTQGISNGYAGLWWRNDGDPGKILSLDNMQDRGPTGTSGWKRYEISVDVPANTKTIYFGVLHPGNGAAWFDNLAIEVNGAPYLNRDNFDLDFESPTTKGFGTGGDGYEITLDNTVAQSGKQSLRISATGASSTAPAHAPDAEQIASRCVSIVKHLQANKAKYLESAKPADVEWAIQMARVVYQSVQMNKGEKSRDESMADNIRWIADQNPNAKIVLWAHNGHIANGADGYVPMGHYLKQMFGREIVNFGFHFNEGSFRAYGGDHKLAEQTIGPAPDGSLDHALAATGIPLFALDLRKLPNSGPVASWGEQRHLSRSIGAVYMGPDAGATLVNPPVGTMFDVILFVNKTTASRPN